MKIYFRYTAYTDAAGKYSPNAERGGNEDNFFVADNLSVSENATGSQDEVLQLGKLGMVMAVADGMGGMQAGEVASQIAVDTVKAAFVKSELEKNDISTHENRQKYLSQVIKYADRAIKSAARSNPAQEGMGSTIVIAWLVENELTIAWCGDSRVYIYNDKHGIRLVTQDHSYVQELVNKGVLTYDQTFDHPQNNIITRSLGDPTKDARPDTKTLKVGKGDIILLCSDGLSGVLRDRKTLCPSGEPCPKDNLESIIANNHGSLKACREALWDAAEKNGWYDNVTVILCEITDGPIADFFTMHDNQRPKEKSFKWLYATVKVVFVLIIAIAAFFVGKYSNEVPAPTVSPVDSIPANDSIKASDAAVVSDSQSKTEQEETNEIPTISKKIKEQHQQPDTTQNKSVLTPIKKETNDSSELKKLIRPHSVNDARKFTPKTNNYKNNTDQTPE